MRLYFFYLILVAAGFLATDISDRLAGRKWWMPWLVFSVFTVASVAFGMYATATPWWGDFESAYYPSAYALQNNAVDLYSENCVDGFVNLPLVAVLFVPFSYLDYTAAIAVFTFLGVLALAASCAGLVKLLDTGHRKSLMLCGLFVINGPAFYSLKEANTSHFILLLLVGMLFLLAHKKDLLLGVLIVLGTLIKIPVGLLGIYYLLRGRWKIVSGMFFTALVVVVISLLVFGVEPHMAWFRKCVEPYAGMPVAAFNVQSVDGFLARLFTESQLFAWRPQRMDADYFVVRDGVLALILLATGGVLWRAGKPLCIEDEYLEFSIILCVLLLVFPLSWAHYYVFMLVPFGLYIAGRIRFPAARHWQVLMSIGIVLVSLPMIGVPPARLALVGNVLVSHYFIGVFLVLLLLLGARNRTARKYSQSSKAP